MIFRKDKNHGTELLLLTPKQRVAYFAFAIGAIFPTLLSGSIGPVFWLFALHLACIGGLAYIRWRSAAFRGSPVVLCAAVVACIASVVAAFVA